MRIALADLAPGRTYQLDACLTCEDTADLLDADLAEPLTVSVQYTMVEGITYLRIATSGKVYARCDRCGVACLADCGCVLDEELTPESDVYDADQDAYVLDGLVDEAVVMSAPRTALCRPDCKGLCPKCGRNLNEQACNCQQSQVGSNNPFGVLQDIFPTGGADNGSTKM